ncbi:methyl-accepting chemotaxis protein [Photobacterium gaetbulicola]|uniref:Putative methyl-accepting chemotaxis protein n=1 Tax=Photobacterium gaetbulicola Gung47 TaxID=658445 RepID=A0A0C5WM42_9GAMM|nr:methyl-accepting chemotaxis protein [Photobacterium gaetbulicola]AJR06149.1 putative methyl-accepting chemotaxis protein [Photobacterium gaetbulicola Gung47]PSU02294.1 methyl-accepting chemotaxis protein [Photobacterium gaetbulicola]
MANKLSFKVKIIITLIAILIATVVTSFFSVNYYLSRYIFDSDAESINTQISLVKDKLYDDIRNKVLIAENISLDITSIQEVTERAGFYAAAKVIADFVITDKGRIDDESEASHYIQLVNSTSGTSVSDIFYQNDIPLISITVPRGNGGDIFYLDLRNTQQLLSQSSVAGSYFDLEDSRGTQVFSNRIDGDLIPYTNRFAVGDSQWTLTGYIDRGYIQQNTNALSGSITMALVLVALISIPLSVLFINTIFKHLSTLRSIIVGLSRGDADLTRRLDVYSNDDLGKIASGINHFIENLQRMMLEVSQSSQAIQHEVAALKDKADSNKSLLTRHTQETEKVVTAINEMSATAESVADSGNRAADFTHATNAEAEKSKDVVKVASSSVNQLSTEVESMSVSIQTMSQDFEKIDAVLHVIGEIAEQTNLLALNAAIEAARAGEQGRGFAVVADEVRALAARTQQSTSEIDTMLSDLRKATSVVVQSMDVTKGSCAQTVEHTANVMASLESMTNSISQINDLTTQIATSANEQSVVTEEVNKNMIAIHDMINELNRNADDSVASTEQLAVTNSQLNAMVANFKLK